MTSIIRPIAPEDYAAWRPLWDGYNAFYGRHGDCALPELITEVTWGRLHDLCEPVFGLVAEGDGRLQGLAHYVLHRSMTRIEDLCYLSDLYTQPDSRGSGVGRALIEAVCAAAASAGSSRVYWHTHESNAQARLLYYNVARNDGVIVYARDSGTSSATNSTGVPAIAVENMNAAPKDRSCSSQVGDPAGHIPSSES